MVFEYLPGGSLDALLRRMGHIPWPDAAAFAAEIARALAAIHAARLVHRDLKPGNVLFDAAGHLKLADFGLARRIASPAGEPDSSPTVADRLTQSGRLVGTPSYVAPEQALGYGQVDGRADVYSLGATLYALVTGRPPFSGKGYALMKQVLSDEPRPPRELVPHMPAELEKLILDLLAKDPENRRSDTSRIAEELDAISRTSRSRSSGNVAPAEGPFDDGSTVR
jgi:serine/threonine protein kinase